jgi:hypothetical protein
MKSFSFFQDPKSVVAFGFFVAVAGLALSTLSFGSLDVSNELSVRSTAQEVVAGTNCPKGGVDLDGDGTCDQNKFGKFTAITEPLPQAADFATTTTATNSPDKVVDFSPYIGHTDADDDEPTLDSFENDSADHWTITNATTAEFDYEDAFKGGTVETYEYIASSSGTTTTGEVDVGVDGRPNINKVTTYLKEYDALNNIYTYGFAATSSHDSEYSVASGGESLNGGPAVQGPSDGMTFDWTVENDPLNGTSSASGAIETHEFTATGTYSYSLEVKDDEGDTTSTSSTIEVDKDKTTLVGITVNPDRVRTVADSPVEVANANVTVESTGYTGELKLLLVPAQELPNGVGISFSNKNSSISMSETDNSGSSTKPQVTFNIANGDKLDFGVEIDLPDDGLSPGTYELDVTATTAGGSDDDAATAVAKLVVQSVSER